MGNIILGFEVPILNMSWY